MSERPQSFRWNPFIEGFNIQNLPITIKLSVMLIMLLLLSGLLVSNATRQVVNLTQQTIVLDDMGSIAEAEAFRIADLIGQQVVILNRLAQIDDVSIMLDAGVIAELDETHNHEEGDNLLLLHPELDNSATQQIANFRQTHAEYDTVVLLDARGHIVAADPVPTQIDTSSPSQWRWYANAISGGVGHTYISAFHEDNLTNFSGVQIAIPLYEEGDLQGVIYAVWNLSNLGGVSSEISNQDVIIVQTDGTLINEAALPDGTTVPIDLLREVNISKAGALVFTTGNGIRWLYGYTSLSEINISEDNPAAQLNWIILSREPGSLLDESVSLVLNRLLLVVGGTVSFTALLMLLLTRYLINPLNRLTESAIQIERGRLNTPIPTDIPKDEVGLLAVTLDSLVGQLNKRLRQLNAAVQVSKSVTVSSDLDQLLFLIASSMVQNFGYPDVRIYTVDKKLNTARIRAAIGPEGELLHRSGHTVSINDATTIGRTILMGEAQFAGGIEAPAFAGSKLRPAEIALPIILAGDILGAFHIIGEDAGSFEPEDVDVLSLVADQIGSAMQNADLLNQSAANIAEIEALNRRLTQQVWEEFVKERADLRHTLDPEEAWPAAPVEFSINRESDAASAEIYTDKDGRAVIAVPLLLRGEGIGTIAATRPPGERWTREEIGVIESVAARMSIIAEGIRLVEESSYRAQREQKVNEVSAELLQRTSDVETVLQNALNQLSGALGSDHIALRIGQPPVETERQIESGPLPDLPDNPNKRDGSGESSINGNDTVYHDNGDGGSSDASE